MYHVLTQVLDRHSLPALQEALADLVFEDGRKTAGGLAKEVKNNAQAAPNPAREAILRKVEASLRAHPVFMAAARPKAFANLLVSRYGPGQTYGLHVDDALMQGARTDLSFTLFLSDPGSYEGGELIVQDRASERAFKLNAGDAILYPSDSLHRVAPLTSGTRFAAVGWVTSWVRDPTRREILFDLDEAIAHEQAAGAARAQLDRLAKTRSNLLRMWAD